MNQQEQITAMANIMVEARRANEDSGELIAAALHKAAEKLGNVEKLVQGRPGSWEADIILRMAVAGGSGNAKRIAALSKLFMELPNVDGGDVLSQSMGKAVNALGGLDEFCGTSQWYWDLRNIGCQYSNYQY